MVELMLVLAVLAVFLLFNGFMMPRHGKDEQMAMVSLSQFRARSIGKNSILTGIASAGARRAMKNDSTNSRYVRWLKQANWYWEPNEVSMPDIKAPFWNLETLWSEKFFGAFVYGGLIAVVLVLGGLVLNVLAGVPMLVFMGLALVFGGAVGFFMFGSPDGALTAAAVKRQKELALEMGFRIPELRADVMAGNTIQRAIRNLSRRPGGPFVEELRRAVAVLDITKDDILAMDQLIERNDSNEILIEFANSLKMVSRQGGQIGPVLNVLADLAQQRLRLAIQAQARKNLQEMTRPIGLSSLVVTTLLIIAPAVAGVMGGMVK